MSETAYPYLLYCNRHGYIGRVAGPGVALRHARKHEQEHDEEPGYVCVLEDGTPAFIPEEV